MAKIGDVRAKTPDELRPPKRAKPPQMTSSTTTP